MGNCHAALLLRAPRTGYAGDSNDEGARSENFAMLVNYAEYYRDWRKCANEYYDVSMVEEKKVLNTLFYGGRCPMGKVPMIHALRMEIKRAALFLAGDMFCKHLWVYYEDRKRALYGHLASILSFEEEKGAPTIHRPLKRDPMCVIRDGAVSSCPAAESLIGIKRECGQIGRELGIGISLKQ